MVKEKKIRVPRTKTLGYKKRIGQKTLKFMQESKDKKTKNKNVFGLRMNKRRIPPGQLRAKVPKIRESIKKGTILILLASAHRGKRVICLGQLPSGLVIITGPFNINGVPIRRVNPAYVIATSVTVDISNINVEKFNDAYFAKKNIDKHQYKYHQSHKNNQNNIQNNESIFINQNDNTNTSTLPAYKKSDQKALDKLVINQIHDKLLINYLKTPFTLRNNMYPHNMKF